jgi:hypothetical protein
VAKSLVIPKHDPEPVQDRFQWLVLVLATVKLLVLSPETL